METTAEFQSATNLLKRVLDKIRSESRASERANLAVIVSVAFAILSLVSIAVAFKVNAKLDYELDATRAELTAVKNADALNNVYLQELYLIMKDADLDPPPLPKE